VTLHWININPGTTAKETLAHLAAFGVSLARPADIETSFYFDVEANRVMQKVGEVMIRPNGAILVWPYRGLTDSATAHLIACAENAFRDKPSTANGWDRHRGKSGTYWTTEFMLPADMGDPAAIACMAAARAFASEQKARRARDLAVAAAETMEGPITPII